MVVKKHVTFENACYQYKLRLLAEYVQELNQQSDFEPGLGELLQNCNRIVDCLVSMTGSESQLNQLLSTAEEFLIRKVTNLTETYRHDVITTILDRIHFVTSNPKCSASSVASVVLVVCVGLDNESILNAARELLDDQEKGAPARLRASLSCFYQWICDWNSRPALGNWLLAFIKVLEEKEHFDILIEISLEHLDNLFLALAAPNAVHRSVSDVILYVMASLREFKPAFDKIAPAINNMLTVLASDSNQYSRQLLQNVVDVSKSMIDNIKKQTKANEFAQFQVKQSRVIISLEQHMGTRSCSFLNLQPWKMGPQVSVVRLPATKPGLVNLGNTCYMNCIIQALFATKQFTNQVVMNMSERPYWSKLGSVFADLMHSLSPKITPTELFSVVKTLFVSVHQQQDCSEFLGHLLSVLTSHELDSEENFDYSRPVKIIPSRKTCTTVVVYESPFSNVIVKHPREPTRSVSPGPGTSTSEPVPSAGKRSNKDIVDDSEDSQNKRQCTIITLDTFVEQTFSGVLLKHIHCSNCQAMSVSREKFRELQLSVPENRRGFRMTIQGLIDFYYSSELLIGDNMYRCYSCGELSTAVRVLFCDIAPQYLIVVLKCFRYDQRVNVQKKLMLSVFLNQSVTLQILNPEVENNYLLYCCVIHEGSAATGGHYYTAAKHSNKWYLFNDDKVSQVGDDYLLKLNRTSTPYMLLYRRSDIIEESNPTLDEIPFKYREKIMSTNKAIDDCERKLQRNKSLTTRSTKDFDVAYIN